MLVRVFQFQTGAIKSSVLLSQNKELLQCFNSKLVRLKEAHVASENFPELCFNSKLVRLKEWELHRARLNHNRVSIPNWCD